MPKNSHKRLTIALIALAVVLIAAGALLMTRVLRHPLSKAVKAGDRTVLDLEASPLGSLVGNLIDHGSITLDADASQMQDFLSLVLSLPLQLDASAQATLYTNEKGVAAQAEVYFKGKRILDGLALYNDAKDITLSSEALFGKTNYGINLKNLSQNLDGSAFDPKENTEYSLSQDLFERLKKLPIESHFLRKLLQEANERLGDILHQGVEYLIDNAKFSSGPMNITLVDRFQAKGLTMTMDGESFCGFLEHLIDFCQKDEKIQAFLQNTLTKLEFLLKDDTAESLRDKIMTELQNRKDQLPELRERLSGATLTTNFYQHKDRLIRVACSVTKGEREIFFSLSVGPEPREAKEISLEYRDTAGTVLSAVYTPSRSSTHYSAKLEVRKNAVDAYHLTINWLKDTGKLHILAQDLEKERSVLLNADLLQENKLTTLRTEKLTITENSTVKESSLKGLTLTLNEAADFPALANFTEITSMSAEQIADVFKDLQESFSGLLGIFNLLGF